VKTQGKRKRRKKAKGLKSTRYGFPFDAYKYV
jgi:hypothetical protein